MMKAIVQRRVADKGKGIPPLQCLNQSWGIMGHLLKPGDRISGVKIVEKLKDTDGEVVYVLEDGSYVDLPAMP